MSDATRLARKIRTECVGMRVRQASRLLTRVYDEALRELGIQESQFSVLVAIACFGEDGATIGPLASVLAMDRTTITRSLTPLEKAGFVRVARSPDDARARVILLTRAGERTIESAYPLWEGAQKRVKSALGQERFDDLRTQLGEVVERREALD
jgi:DNA-binding MarR family transcriptional regulator